MNYEKIGAFLKKEREQKGLSYYQVFEITRIQPSILRSIEEGKPEISEAFFKNFIKTYVKFLDLDLDVVLKQEDIKNNPNKEKTVEHKKNNNSQSYSKRSVFIAMAWLLVFIFVGSFFFNRNSSNESEKHALNTQTGEEKADSKQKADLLEITEEALSQKSDEKTNQADSNPNYMEDKENQTKNQKDIKPEGAKGQQNLDTKNSKALLTNQDKTSLNNSKKDENLWSQIRNTRFQQELMIKTLEPVKIYFKIDQQPTLTKDLRPLVWFVIKAKESLYIRFDEKVNQVEMFYNGVKWDIPSSARFFEKTFKTQNSKN